MTETESWIRAWIADAAQADAAPALGPDDDFLAGGVLDSFDIIQLIGAIEERFGVSFDQNDFENPAFSTIAGLGRAVDRHREAAKGAR